jgi:hypothetical protein
MTRYMVLLALVLGTAATAIASIVPFPTADHMSPRNLTVVEKNQAFPLVGPLVVVDCATPDCEGTSL